MKPFLQRFIKLFISHGVGRFRDLTQFLRWISMKGNSLQNEKLSMVWAGLFKSPHNRLHTKFNIVISVWTKVYKHIYIWLKNAQASTAIFYTSLSILSIFSTFFFLQANCWEDQHSENIHLRSCRISFCSTAKTTSSFQIEMNNILIHKHNHNIQAMKCVNFLMYRTKKSSSEWLNGSTAAKDFATTNPKHLCIYRPCLYMIDAYDNSK